MLKMSDNPEIRSPLINSIAEADGTWWVGHTRARAEKAFAQDLLRKNIPYFLPMATRVRISGGRKRTTLIPLFTSYVFFCGTSHDRVAAFDTGRICNAIEVTSRDEFLGQMSRIEMAYDGGVALDLHPWAVVGQQVRVTEGPMAGVVGRISNRDDMTLLVLEISVLGQAAFVKIEPELLEPV